MIRRLGVVGAIASIVVTTACSQQPTATPATSTTRTSSSTSRATTPTSSTTPASRDLTRALGRVVAGHPGADVAVAWAPVGTKGRVQVVGDAQPLVAWSTIKVPLSLAVVRAGHGASMSGDIELALTASDNEAASRLWADLGSGPEASRAVEEQLHRGRDRRTGVPAEVTVPGYSPFGQAVWRLTDQTRFTATLPCLAGSTTVTEAMGRVIDGQRWGLGGVDGARYKGGWGSTPDGYVVRQLGIVPGTKGETAVALQVRAGTHEEGTTIADELVRALRQERAQLPVGSCG